MFQQPLMMMPEEQELTIDQKLKKFKDSEFEIPSGDVGI